MSYAENTLYFLYQQNLIHIYSIQTDLFTYKPQYIVANSYETAVNVAQKTFYKGSLIRVTDNIVRLSITNFIQHNILLPQLLQGFIYNL